MRSAFACRIGSWAATVFLCAAVSLFRAAPTQAQCYPEWLRGSNIPATDGDVFALRVLANGNLVIAGRFNIAGAATVGNIARWNGADWAPLGSGLNGDVLALEVLPNGDLIAAGDFSASGSTTVSHIARWDGTAWRALGVGLNQGARSLAVAPNGDLIVGGGFTSAGGVPAKSIARWNGTVWSSLGSGPMQPSPTVLSLRFLANGQLIAAGTDIADPNQSIGFVDRWDGIAWSQMGGSFVGTYPDPPHSVGTGSVNALDVTSTGELVAGGFFLTMNGSPLRGVAKWTGSTWAPLGSGLNVVSAFAHSPAGELVACGTFSAATGSPANYVARWDGAQWLPLGSGPDSPARAAAVMPSGELVTGGSFYAGESGGEPRSPLSRWNGTTWSAWGAGTNGWLDAMAVMPNGDLVVGGRFTSIEGTAANRIARNDGLMWHPLGSGVDGFVIAMLALRNGDLVIGGDFAVAGGVPAADLARWNGSEWSAIGGGVSGGGGYPSAVSALAELPNGDLVIGGQFTSAGGVTAANIARWDGTTWHALGAGTSGYPSQSVSALAVLPNGEVIAGGGFSSPASRIARWNGSSWLSLGTGIDPSYQTGVSDLALVPGGDLIVGGRFESAGGIPARSIARWNGSSWSALGTGIGTLRGLTVLPGGDPIVADGTLLLRWHNSLWSPFAPAANYWISALATLPNGTLVMGGGFTMAGNRVSAYLGRFNCACYANCDNSTLAPVLNISDFVCFLTAFAAGNPYANCDTSTAPPTLNVADFVCFLNRFAAGCSQ
jgi:hypothetical protein